jgi:PAS domain-containing protein
MNSTISFRRVVRNAAILSGALSVALLSSYVLCGHAAIKLIYESNLSTLLPLMAGKATTPLQNYFATIDRSMLILALGLALAGALVWLLSVRPVGLIFSGLSFALCTLGLFLILDLFPALVKPLHFDMIPYFNYRLTYMPDPVLGFRERPYHKDQIRNFRGYGYSPLYGINVAPETVRWQTDEEGFRNQSEIEIADVAVVGASFPEYGADLDDTYPKRLEKKLPGKKVVNFSKAGYGPIAYLKVFEQYTVKKKPKFVLFALYVAGDVEEHLLDWVRGKKDAGLAKRAIVFGGFFPRYQIALQQAGAMLTASVWTTLQLGFDKIMATQSVHPDIAVLELPDGETEKMVFLDRHLAKKPEELLGSPQWQALEKVLLEFKRVSESNRIVPLLLYIPGATEVYSPYSRLDSGANWLAIREAQIATSSSNEEATRELAERVGIELIDLRPVFEQAAARGKFLYYRLDAHWNAEGREVAAAATAKRLKELMAIGPTETEPSKSEEEFDPTLQQAMLDRRDGVMLRTIDGKINFWNVGAQHLYGWTKNEAVGKVSHDLLRTQFPEPLAKIDAELIRTGKWEGKLVHSTRDGRRIEVESRWVLDPQGPPGSVVEINTPAG